MIPTRSLTGSGSQSRWMSSKFLPHRRDENGSVVISGDRYWVWAPSSPQPALPRLSVSLRIITEIIDNSSSRGYSHSAYGCAINSPLDRRGQKPWRVERLTFPLPSSSPLIPLNVPSTNLNLTVAQEEKFLYFEALAARAISSPQVGVKVSQ